MICFRDMAFCSARCANTDCRRNFTDELRKAAREWWGSEGAPVCFSDFRTGCDEYREEVACSA